MASIRDVAREAGVSIATVSGVLNGNRPVSQATRHKVLSAIDKLNYRPNLLAKALLGKRSGLIGVFVPSIANPFFSGIIETIEDIAHEKAHGVFVCNSHGSVERIAAYIDTLVGMQVDGVLVTLSSHIVESQLISEFMDLNVPVVGFAGVRSVSGIDCYMIDDRDGGLIACRYLLRAGHRAIAYIGPNPKTSSTSALRLEGIRLAIEELKPGDEANVVVGYCSRDADTGYQAAAQLLSSEAVFSAVICYNDLVASGVINAVKDLGLSVPGHISVIGFDNTLAPYLRPKLTTVAVDREALAKAALERLFARIEADNKLEPQKVTMPMQLIPRASVSASANRKRAT